MLEERIVLSRAFLSNAETPVDFTACLRDQCHMFIRY